MNSTTAYWPSSVDSIDLMRPSYSRPSSLKIPRQNIPFSQEGVVFVSVASWRGFSVGVFVVSSITSVVLASGTSCPLTTTSPMASFSCFWRASSPLDLSKSCNQIHSWLPYPMNSTTAYWPSSVDSIDLMRPSYSRPSSLKTPRQNISAFHEKVSLSSASTVVILASSTSWCPLTSSSTLALASSFCFLRASSPFELSISCNQMDS